MRRTLTGACRHQDLSVDELYLLYGVSRHRRGFGYRVAVELERRGFTFFIVHPEAEQIDRWQPIRSLTQLSQTPHAAILCSPAAESGRILAELDKTGVRRVFASWGSLDQAGYAVAAERGLDVCEDCPLLHMKGLGFPHNLHRGIVRWMRRPARKAQQVQDAVGSP